MRSPILNYYLYQNKLGYIYFCTTPTLPKSRLMKLIKYETNCLPEQNTSSVILYQEVYDEYLGHFIRRILYIFSVPPSVLYYGNLIVYSLERYNTQFYVIPIAIQTYWEKETPSTFIQKLILRKLSNRTYELEQIIWKALSRALI